MVAQNAEMEKVKGRLTILSKYLLKQNLYLLALTLALGLGVYLLTDLFERLDNFLEAGVSMKVAAQYFLVKIPLIISQILPAAFLLAALVQLCFMAKSRELIALQAGGISLGKLLQFFLVYGFLWGCLQLIFSQGLGVWGEQYANAIWRQEVAGNAASKQRLSNVWFLDGNWVVNLDRISTASGDGTGFTGYELSENGLEVKRMVRAAKFHAQRNAWRLFEVTTAKLSSFSQKREDEVVLDLVQAPENFTVFTSKMAPAKLSLWNLGETIRQLESAGSNVEGLKTVWHSKIAYAFSLMVMGIMALAIVTWRDTVYLSVGVGLLCVFLFYVLFTVGGTLGEKGILSPFWAAWLFPLVIFGLSLLRLIWTLYPNAIRHLHRRYL